MNTVHVPVFILCGGLGTRIKEETEFRPKPMVPIGEHPVLWHVMQSYARHGFHRFVLCLGFKADVVKDYFTNFHLRNADSTINLKTNAVTVHEHRHQLDWEVTLAFTGEKNMTGSRIAQAARKYLGAAEHFAVTYGDGLTDANLRAEFDDHLAGGKTGTVLGVNPPSDVWNEATVPPVNANVPVVVGSVSVPVLTIVIAPVVAVNWSVV